jgi:putative two-component system response regulator
MASVPSGARVVILDAACEDGLAEAVSRLRLAASDVAVVVASEGCSPETVRAALDAGAVSFVVKASAPELVRDTIHAALDGRGLLDPAVVRPVIGRYAALLEESRRRDRAIIESLAAAVEVKDTVTSRHLHEVSKLATQLASLVEPNLASSEDFAFGCLLHDVGKIGVPEQILTKAGPLNEDEWRLMRRHPQAGARVIRPLGLSSLVGDIVLYHHERWDGYGYPARLAAEEIPLAARIFSVCDALEAMTAPRPYRGALPAPVAFERVRIEAGHQFDPQVVAALERGVADGTVTLPEAAPSEHDGVAAQRRVTRPGW